jgi:SAM-dependent methyltransferase
MAEMIHHSSCPVCHSANIRNVLTTEDFTVTHQTFAILECAECTVRFTQDAPGPSSIAPYYKSDSYISHTNTETGIINQLYQRVRRVTLQQKRKLIQRATGLGKGNLLDIGAGTGAFVHEMDRNGWTVTGIEPDEGARTIADSLYRLKLKEPAFLYNIEPETFDAITLWHVLEHVHSLHDYIEQVKNLLKKNGKIFIAVPNYTSLDARVYGPRWAAYDVPRHLYHFSPLSMEKLVSMHALSLKACKPMWFDSFYISMLSSQYKHGTTDYIGACWNGLRSNTVAMFNRKRASSLVYIISK